MKRKIVVHGKEHEIDCGDETCRPCKHRDRCFDYCDLFHCRLMRHDRELVRIAGCNMAEAKAGNGGN